MELMVVLLIIGLMGAAVSVAVRGARAQGRKTTTELEIRNIVDGLEMYNSLTARYPTQEEGLEILLQPIGEFSAGILKKKGRLNDPWGSPYLYVVTTDAVEPFEVLSVGADRREGTEDDISSLTTEELN